MKKNLLLSMGLFGALIINAQDAIVNGTPLSIIDGSSITLSDSLDIGGYATNIASSPDGKKLVATTFTDMLVIDMATKATDHTFNGFSARLTAGNGTEMHGCSGTQFYTIDLSDNTIDSISIPGSNRIRRRPGSDEIWVTTDSVCHVVDVSSGATLSTTITTGSHQYDGSDVRFTSDGMTAVKLNWNSKSIVKIDADAKTITSTFDMNFATNLGGVEVSSDGSIAVVSNSTQSRLYQVDLSNMTLMDSVTTPNPVFGMYRHPATDMIWGVGHFDDVIYIIDPTDLSIQDSVQVGSSPHIVEFVNWPVGVDQTKPVSQIQVYPNPSIGNVTVHGVDKDATWILTDALGKVIHEGNGAGPIDISNLTSGLYYFRSGMETQKLIVL